MQIFTGSDLADAKVGGLPCGWLIHSKDGSPMKEPPHPVLAQGKVRHVGDQVALVVAETLWQAKDAAELIEVDYQELPAVIDITSVESAGSAVHDDVSNNVCYDWGHGNKDAVDAAFAKAAKVTKLEFSNNRLIPNAIEPRAANAQYTRHDDSYTLYVANQNPHVERLLMSAFVLGLPESKVRVIAPDVGGGFGSKIFLYPEETALVWASKRVGRPIKWTAERSESFLVDAHGRDHATNVELAMDAQGNFLALRVKTVANMGAYLSTFASSVPTILYATLLAGQYKTPAIYAEVKAVFTNTAPVDAYRGAGRPEATYVVERIVEQAARDMKMDPGAIRRQNFITEFPHATPVGLTYDTGDYAAHLDKAKDLADVAGFAARKAASQAKGKLRGLGYSCYIEACGLAPSSIAGALGARAGLFEAGEVRVHPTGTVTVFTGSHSHGQGHETTFAQVVAGKLGIPVDNVEIVHGDTGRVPFGMGTYGSRSLAVGGTAIVKAVDKIIAKGKKIAAHLLEASDTDIVFENGEFKVAGTDKKVPFGAGGADRLRAAQLPARQARAGAQRERVLRSEQLHVPGGQPHLRGGGRSRDRKDDGREVHRGRRLRQHRQPDDRAGPDARRHRARARPGDDGRLRVRPVGPVADRFVHGLHDAARGRPAELHGRPHRHAVHAQPARREGLRRSGRDRLAGRLHERIDRRPGRARPRDAGHRRARVARGRHADLDETTRSTHVQLRISTPGRSGRGGRGVARRCALPCRRTESRAGDEAQALVVRAARRSGRHRRPERHQGRRRQRGDRRDDHARRGGELGRREEGDPGARVAGRGHRRPDGAQHGHDRRLDRERRPGSRLPGRRRRA